MNLTDIGVVKALLKKHGFSFSRSLGQNFLINPSVCPKIAGFGGCSGNYNNTGVLEIGAGIGVLTKELAKLYKKVVAVEIDRSLAPILTETLEGLENIEIIFGDVMEINLAELIKTRFKDMDVVCCANLPYYITSPVIMRLLEEDLPLKAITVMVQKEAATRITAKPGTRDCGAVSLAVRYYGEPQKLFSVSRGSFIPAPNVDSSVIKITVNKKYNLDEEEKNRFFRIVKSVFSQRRKQIINPLSSDFKFSKFKIQEMLSRCGILPTARAENLSIEDFLNLSKLMGEIL